MAAHEPESVQLCIEFIGANPPMCCSFVVPVRITLYQLHLASFAVMGGGLSAL